MNKISSGILLFKKDSNIPKVFLVHPGGPFWAKKDSGAWSISKGLVEEGEDLKDTAIREVKEELGLDLQIDISKFKDIGEVRMKSGKIIHAFAYETDFGDIQVKSNLIVIDWPPKSGKKMQIPEVDKGEWFDLQTASKKINPSQIDFLKKLDPNLSSDSQEKDLTLFS
ncbi:MAG: NUDIX domain-containing protein [Candidatus Dojkabacteria bacterium]